MEDIQSVGPMEQNDPFKRATRKRYYNCLSIFEDIHSIGVVDQIDPSKVATKKRDYHYIYASKPLRHSSRKCSKLKASPEAPQYIISFDEDDDKTISQIFIEGNS